MLPAAPPPPSADPILPRALKGLVESVLEGLGRPQEKLRSWLGAAPGRGWFGGEGCRAAPAPCLLTRRIPRRREAPAASLRRTLTLDNTRTGRKPEKEGKPAVLPNTGSSAGPGAGAAQTAARHGGPDLVTGTVWDTQL